MRNKITVSLVIALILLNLPVYSQVVAVACIENFQDQQLPTDITLYFENKLLDSLFNDGAIVTSLPYSKKDQEDYNNSSMADFYFESEPDYLIVLYFLYEKSKRYEEYKRKNVLPCKSIACKIFKNGKKDILYKDEIILDKAEGVGIYQKVDFCLSKFNSKILEKIRGSL